ncbi:MAG: hypothetical protein RMA76_29485 [Deltaproteobacteria bacterium]|jgi:hypothetical protein
MTIFSRLRGGLGLVALATCALVTTGCNFRLGGGGWGAASSSGYSQVEVKNCNDDYAVTLYKKIGNDTELVTTLNVQSNNGTCSQVYVVLDHGVLNQLVGVYGDGTCNTNINAIGPDACPIKRDLSIQGNDAGDVYPWQLPNL